MEWIKGVNVTEIGETAQSRDGNVNERPVTSSTANQENFMVDRRNFCGKCLGFHEPEQAKDHTCWICTIKGHFPANCPLSRTERLIKILEHIKAKRLE